MEIVEDKKQQIINAAIKRFSHFGIFKTSMIEIAEDVALSKANLYYYFPDKWTLIEAIVDVFLKEADDQIQAIFESYNDIEARLLKLVDFQFEYISKYRMFFQNIQEFHSAEPRIRSLADKLFVRECEIMEQVFENAVRSGQIVTNDVKKTSKLYVMILKGLAHLSVFEAPSLSLGVLDTEALDRMIAARKDAVQLMLHGLSVNKKQTI